MQEVSISDLSSAYVNEHAQAEPVFRLPTEEAIRKEADEGSGSLIWDNFWALLQEWKLTHGQSASATSTPSSQTAASAMGASLGDSLNSATPGEKPRMNNAAVSRDCHNNGLFFSY